MEQNNRKRTNKRMRATKKTTSKLSFKITAREVQKPWVSKYKIIIMFHFFYTFHSEKSSAHRFNITNVKGEKSTRPPKNAHFHRFICFSIRLNKSKNNVN